MAKKKAELIFHERIDYADGAIIEMKLWRVPSSVPPAGSRFQILAVLRPSRRPRGPIRQRARQTRSPALETAYRFSAVEQLIADFLSDVRTVRGET
jgi:hypothetical protein